MSNAHRSDILLKKWKCLASQLQNLLFVLALRIIPARVWIWFQCSPVFYRLKINFHCKMVRGWKSNMTVVFRDRDFGRWLGLDKFIRVESLLRNPGNFIWSERDIRGVRHAYMLPASCLVCSQQHPNSVNKKAITGCSPQNLYLQNCDNNQAIFMAPF